jgi:hypothetical protein
MAPRYERSINCSISKRRNSYADRSFEDFAEKRIRHIDDIDKTGTIEQKRKCLKDVICKTFLPVFYSHQFPSQNGVRYPGDGGPDPQVETDYESDEGLNHRLDTSVPNAIVPTLAPRPKAEPTWKVIRMTAEGQQAYLVHRKGLRAREKANRTEDEELIDLAKRKIYSTRATKRKWLGKSRAVSHNAGTRISTVNLGNLGAALGKQWPVRPDFQRVLDLLARIQNGDEPENSLVVIDDEFLQHSRRLLEVALVELISGKVLLDTRVKHDCTTRELFKRPDGSDFNREHLGIQLATLTHVYGASDRRKCSRVKTADEIAEMIIKSGITPKSIILTWHLGTMDLDLLRELLESAGNFNI